ncbi:Por secretion system C-terminal sorting domain-containing protein, partial [Flavobacterium granuli]
SGLAAGTYSWKVKDANECVKSGTVTISIPADIAASAVANNPLCFGVANTGFTITASGGTGSLMYSKDNGATYVASGVFSGLSAGTYSWKVKDANECVKSGTVTITIPADIAASAVANNPLCFGVANTGFTITASGGTGTLMYSKDNGATYVASGVFSGLSVGTYSWKVKDANECVKSGTVTITIPADIAASAVANNPLCFGVANTGFTITASGGTGTLMYSKDNGATYVASGVFSGLSVGTYSWKVKDANECVKSGTVTISIPAIIVANVTPANPKCCYEPNGSITIAASGGTATLMYSINDGVSYQASNVFSGLLAGEYKWVVKDANNCILKGTVTLTNPPLIAASSTLVNPICHGGTDGSITIIASGGTGTLMYSIDQGNTYHTSNVFTGLAAGEYKWRVKDANDCLLKGTFILTSPPAVIVTSTLVNPKCNGGTDGSITINATGGNSPLMYSINDGATYQTSQVFNALAAGQYQWAVKEGNGCITRGTVNLIAPTLIVASATPTNPKCNGGTDGSFTITATGGTGTLMYSKDDGSTYQTSNVFAGLTAGEYKWAVKDVNDCVKKGIVTLANPTLISVSVSAVNPSCCEALKDGSITLNASGGTAAFLYSINDGATYQVSNFFGNLSAGEYKWMVKDANNCLTSGTVILRNPSDPLARPAAQTKTASFTAYPVPFKDVLTIRYDFDYTSDVKIEVFNMQGILVLSKTDTNSYLNKEIMLHLHTYKEQEEIFIVKLTTDRGNSVKKVMSSK